MYFADPIISHPSYELGKCDSPHFPSVTAGKIGAPLTIRQGQPIILDNVSKRNIRPTLKEAGVTWHGFYSIRRFHATQVRMESKSSETAAKALGNTKDVCDKHYIKPETVLPDVRKAVNDAFSGLIH
jgi:hypothetical protein